MKRIASFVLAVMVGMTLIACAGMAAPAAGSAPAAAAAAAAEQVKLSGVPDFVNDAFMKASEDVLIGIGTYKIGNNTAMMSQGKTMAETRARADISRQMQSIVKNMVTDYTASSELDPSAGASFQESITQALSKADLKGSKTIAMNTDQNGILWVVMEYSRSQAAKDFDAANAAAKLAVPAAAAFDAMNRMDTAFDKAAAGGPSTDIAP